MRFNLKPMFEPDTIAVVGVSTSNIHNPGAVIFQRNLIVKGFFSEKVFGVNPKGGLLEGRQLYKSIRDIPSDIDLAVLCLRAGDTLAAFQDAVDVGVKSTIVISGGFSETGTDGRKMQDEMAKLAIDNVIPVVGPNCIGVYNPGWVNTFIIPNERFVVPKPGGNLAIVSQSGGILADQWFCKFFERDIPISSAISLGNKAVIDEVDLLQYYELDPHTEVIGFYLEGFARNKGREFLLNSRLTNKTLIMMKGGRSSRGEKAASSHTAAVASDMRVLEGAFKQFSIINCNTEQELITYAKTFTLLTGKNKAFISSEFNGNLAILTVSGGHGVVASDLAQRYGLKVVEFTTGEKASMQEALSPTVKNIASLENPIDITGSCNDDDVVNLLHVLMKNDRVELVLLLILPYPPGLTMSLGSRIAGIVRLYKKPVITYLPWLARYEMIKDSLNEANIPVGNSIEEAILMAHAVYLKAQAVKRARFNKVVNTEDVLLEDYNVFTEVLDQINKHRAKLQKKRDNQEVNTFDGTSA